MVARKFLNLEVNAGLCNRLRALVAGICWAQKLDRTLVVYWPSFKPECAAGFWDLFLFGCLPEPVLVKDDSLKNAESCLQVQDAQRIFAGKDAELEINIKSHGNFWGSSDSTYIGSLRYLMPSAAVRDMLDRWKENGLDSSKIAFHIRMTDNEKAIRLSPFDSFVRQINLTSGPIQVFTDEPRAILALQEMFGQRILSFEKLRKRNTLDGMIEATAVFFALASKETIFGSGNSSFSEIAREFGGARLIVVTA